MGRRDFGRSGIGRGRKEKGKKKGKSIDPTCYVSTNPGKSV